MDFLSVFAWLLVAMSLGVSGQVINVNTSNSGEFLSKRPLILEFYAPWCAHCKNFEPHYASIANILNTQHGFQVGSCDSGANPALAARFDVTTIPTIFLYRNGAMWKYEGVLLRDPIIDWATRTYRNKSPIPWLVSPVGPMGTSKGLLIRIGDSVVQLMPYLTENLGLPHWAGFVIIAGSLAMSILLMMLVIIYFTLKIKED